MKIITGNNYYTVVNEIFVQLLSINETDNKIIYNFDKPVKITGFKKSDKITFKFANEGEKNEFKKLQRK